MKKLLIISLGIVLFAKPAIWANQVLILSGIYSGKDLYVQNPILPDNKFSTEEVYVNEKLVLTRPMTSAFTVDLSFLTINEPVEVRIVHNDGFRPRIINAHVIRNNVTRVVSSYAPVENVFRWINVDGTTLRWLTHGEKGEGTFEIQKAHKEDWKIIGQVPADLQANEKVYRVPVKHKAGENTYRIKLTDRDGYVTYSDPIDYKVK